MWKPVGMGWNASDTSTEFDSSALLLADPVHEDEQHVLLHHPLYENLRSSRSSRSQKYLLTDIESIFNDLWTIGEVGRLIKKIFEKRFLKTATAQQLLLHFNFLNFWFINVFMIKHVSYRMTEFCLIPVNSWLAFPQEVR